MNYNDKVASLIDIYLFDDMETWTQDQFDDLEWKRVTTKGWMRKLPKGQSETPVRSDKKYLVSWAGGLGTPNSVSILSANDIHSHNAQSQSGMVLDAGYFHSYAEIPKKEYFFNKFYKDKYKSIKDATTGLLKKYTTYKAEQEARAKTYNKKWDIIDHASFFAISNLQHPVKMDISLKEIPFIFENKNVGTGVLVEYDKAKIHLAMNLKKNFSNFDHKEIGKKYYIEYQTEENSDNDNTYITDIKNIILKKV